ncbi:MAG TPA: hypothetical protein PLV93_03505 [Microthrixaceae bacterium]|nr:hypothetical protein [Microthrixaceae bacterium]
MFLAIRDLRRGVRRFALLGAVIALVAVLSTVLSGLATGLVTDGISGLRALPLDRIVLQEGAKATFSRSTLRSDALEPFEKLPGVEATPLGASFVNAASTDGGPSLDVAMFGVAPDSFLVDRPEAPAYHDSVLYIANNNPLRLEARAEADGTLLWSWTPPLAAERRFVSEVLLTDNLVFVSTNATTYAIDRQTRLPVWSHPLSGKMALSRQGVLYLQGETTLVAVNLR